MKEKQMSTFFKKVFDTDVAALSASVHKPLSLALSPSLPPSLSPCCWHIGRRLKDLKKI